MSTRVTPQLTCELPDHMTRRGMSRTFQAVPDAPISLLVIAPTSPATRVPCPEKSLGSLSGVAQSSPSVTPVSVVRSTKSHPATSSTYPLPSSS